jgi:hypothetical protein
MRNYVSLLAFTVALSAVPVRAENAEGGWHLPDKLAVALLLTDELLILIDMKQTIGMCNDAADTSMAVPPQAQSLASRDGDEWREGAIRFQRCYSWLRNFTLSYFAAGTM